MVRVHFAIASLSLVSAYDEEYHHTQLLQTKVAVDETAATKHARGQLKLKEVALKWKHSFIKKGKKAKQPSYGSYADTAGSSEGSYGDTAGSSEGSYGDTAGSSEGSYADTTGMTFADTQSTPETYASYDDSGSDMDHCQHLYDEQANIDACIECSMNAMEDEEFHEEMMHRWMEDPNAALEYAFAHLDNCTGAPNKLGPACEEAVPGKLFGCAACSDMLQCWPGDSCEDASTYGFTFEDCLAMHEVEEEEWDSSESESWGESDDFHDPFAGYCAEMHPDSDPDCCSMACWGAVDMMMEACEECGDNDSCYEEKLEAAIVEGLSECPEGPSYDTYGSDTESTAETYDGSGDSDDSSGDSDTTGGSDDVLLAQTHKHTQSKRKAAKKANRKLPIKNAVKFAKAKAAKAAKVKVAKK